MIFQAYGDQAILINFKQQIDWEVNAKVIKLHRLIQESKVPGITFSVPAYCSLTIGFDPRLITYNKLCKRLTKYSKKTDEIPTDDHGRFHEIPVCYKSKFSIDIEEVSAITSLTPKEIVQLHTQMTYKVFMLGFLPGFGYMGRLPEKLYCKRKAIPRKTVPALSVGLAGFQTGIYPSEAPGGWQIIGRTPIKIFDPKKKQPFLFKPGDKVRFYTISEPEYFQMIGDEQ